MAGDADEPPYASVLAAMRDGWRVIQLPAAAGRPRRGAEHDTAFLKYEFVLEKLVEADAMDAPRDRARPACRWPASSPTARCASTASCRARSATRRWPSWRAAARRRRSAPIPPAPPPAWPGRPLAGLFRDWPALTAVLELPAVAAVIESLLGPDPLYDHHYAHVIAPRQRVEPALARRRDPRSAARAPSTSSSASSSTTRRARWAARWILPGSHLRRVNEAAIARYQNFVGAGGDGLPGRLAAGLPPRHLALRPAEPDRPARARCSSCA